MENINKKKLDEMFEIQNNLNKSINQDWLDIRSQEEWIRAFWLEIAELIESLPWKWWKGSDADINNLKIEFIDCFHFMLSFILQNEYIANNSFQELLLNELSKESKEEDLNYHDLIKKLEVCICNMLSGEYKNGIILFSEAILSVLTFEEIYNLYVGKNYLNSLRQDYGYKSGNYTKIIDGREDNEYLMEYVNQGIGLEEIKISLERVVSSVNKKL